MMRMRMMMLICDADAGVVVMVVVVVVLVVVAVAVAVAVVVVLLMLKTAIMRLGENCFCSLGACLCCRPKSKRSDSCSKHEACWSAWGSASGSAWGLGCPKQKAHQKSLHSPARMRIVLGAV